MGRIVIETDPETGKDHVELTLDNGQVMIFHGDGRSQLSHHKAEVERVDVSTGGKDEWIPGRAIPQHWSFSINIENIPGVIMNDAPEET